MFSDDIFSETCNIFSVFQFNVIARDQRTNEKSTMAPVTFEVESDETPPRIVNPPPEIDVGENEMVNATVLEMLATDDNQKVGKIRSDTEREELRKRMNNSTKIASIIKHF